MRSSVTVTAGGYADKSGQNGRRGQASVQTAALLAAHRPIPAPVTGPPEFDPIAALRHARGMTVRETCGDLEKLYGIDVSPDLISAVTGALLDEVEEWQNRPIDICYPLVFFDAIRVKVRDEGFVRKKAIYVALGVLPDGTKESRGVQDILIA
jgi:hypothetical protein